MRGRHGRRGAESNLFPLDIVGEIGDERLRHGVAEHELRPNDKDLQ